MRRRSRLVGWQVWRLTWRLAWLLTWPLVWRRAWRPRWAAWLRCMTALGLALASATAQAGVLRACDAPAPISAEQQDTLLRFAALIKAELDRSGQRVAIVSRSGMDLSRFGHRYSHAGIALLASPNAPWSVRQLYFACDEGKPRIFDQGIAGFVLGTSSPDLGYVSVVLLPPEQAAQVERKALDNALALQLLGGTYSANAYAFDSRYQNCNQWVMEILAAAWGAGAEPPPIGAEPSPRAQAQRWLKDQGYLPSEMTVHNPALMLAAAFVPYLHNDDHPTEDIARSTYRVSMPASVEGFVQGRLPGATRVEFCHKGQRMAVRRGWGVVMGGCGAGLGDAEVTLD